MILDYLISDVMMDLKGNISSYNRRYVENDREWFEEYFKKNEGLQSSKIEIKDFDLNMDPDYNKSDFENIKTLYSAMKTIPPSVAGDERLWAGLAHGKFWDFVQYRRNEEIRSGDNKKILYAYFFTHNTRRSTYLHCLSRLWWAGYMTYDESRSDPFELTKVISDHAFGSTLLLLSSCNFTANKNVFQGLLDSLKKRKVEGQSIKREYIVEASRYLMSLGSLTILDSLSNKRVEELIDDYLDNNF